MTVSPPPPESTGASPVGSPRATVAIPVYNSAPTLERCLRSATAQTLRDIEIIVADDASTDGSGELAEAFARTDARVRVIRLPSNGGKSRAMNRMVAAARGEWIAVLDADDCFREDRLERLITAAEAHGVEMAVDNLAYFDAGLGRVVRTAFDPGTSSRLVALDDFMANNSALADFDYGILKPVARKDFLNRHGLTYYEDTRLAEDFYYLMKFFVAGGRAFLVGDPLYCWTLPFNTVSRAWTKTGAGAWRYDYRQALAANSHFLAEMEAQSRPDVVAMLQARASQYRIMTHYLDAQRQASEGRFLAALRTISTHPSTYRLLASRIAGRAARAVGARLRDSRAPTGTGAVDQHGFGSAR